MPREQETITTEIAEMMLEDSYGPYPGDWFEGWRVVAKEEGGDRRWMRGVSIYLQHGEDGPFYVLKYDKGLTENQDNEYPWRASWGNKPEKVTIDRVYPTTKTVQVTTWSYEPR